MQPRAKLRPLKGRVLVELQPPATQSAGGILIPEVAQDESREAIVRAIGEGAPEFVLGDRVVLSDRAPGVPLVMHPRKMKLLEQGQIKAVFV